MSLEQIATSGVAIDTSGHHRRIRTDRFSDHFSPDTASTNHSALTRPTEDIYRRLSQVRFGPKADIPSASRGTVKYVTASRYCANQIHRYDG
jgi:hypothetical protein